MCFDLVCVGGFVVVAPRGVSKCGWCVSDVGVDYGDVAFFEFMFKFCVEEEVSVSIKGYLHLENELCKRTIHCVTRDIVVV